MDVTEARKIVSAITYRPGHRLSISCHDGKASFNMGVVIPNSNPANRWGDNDFGASFAGLPFDLTEVETPRQLMDKLWAFLTKWERHETLEWFKLHGQNVFCPHRSDGRAFFDATDENYALNTYEAPGGLR